MKYDAVPVGHLVYDGCNEGLAGPWVEESIPETGRGAVGAVRGPEEGYGRAPRPEVLSACLAKAAQWAAAEWTGEVSGERWWLATLLYDLVGARAQVRGQEGAWKRRPPVFGVCPWTQARFAPLGSWPQGGRGDPDVGGGAVASDAHVHGA